LKRHSSGFIIGIVVSIVLGFGIVAGVALGLRSIWGIGYEPPNVTYATKTGPNSATLELATFPDSLVCHPNADAQQSQWVTYCSSTNLQGTNLAVPPNSVITVVIKQYDTATTLINDYFRQARGTIGGTMLVNGKSMSQISADAPGHTFTLQSPPDSSYPLFVSVPLLGVPNNAPSAVTINGNQYPKPNVISFQFRTGPPGTYIWHCYVPCGSNRGVPYGFSGPMSTTGYMAGTLTVAGY
jgi:hypothetical protein